LMDLSCSTNQLSSLDVSNNSSLVFLACSANLLSNLDVSHCNALKSISCSDNKLTALDVTNCLKLANLKCEYNLLTSLDISKCPALMALSCDHNQLTVLDVSSSSHLNKLVKSKKPKEWSESTALRWPGEKVSLTLYKSGNRTSSMELDTGLTMDKTTALYSNRGRVSTVSTEQIIMENNEYTLTRTSREKKPTAQLTISFEPAYTTDQKVQWSSSDKKTVAVDQKGNIRAVRPGKAIITCALKSDESIKVTCTVTVDDRLVKKITLSKKKVTVKAGESTRISVKTISPADAFNQSVKWSSSDKKIATVDKNGNVKAKKKGTCKITCTAADGNGATASCTLIVK